MKKYLVVIDMQKDFVDGALGTKEAVTIVPAVVKKIKEYPKENVLLTMDTHPESYMDQQEGKYLPVPHCIRGTEGWQLVPEVKEATEGCMIFEKNGFGSVVLMEYLRELAEEEHGEIEFEFVGLCTDICVVVNALLAKAAIPEVRISADASCMAGVTPEKHAAAIEVMRSCQIQIL